MTETIFIALILVLIFLIIVYVIHTIIKAKIVSNSKVIDHINSKLQQIIEEANSEKEIRDGRRLNKHQVLANDEKERLLRDDFIYNKIKQSILFGTNDVLLLKNKHYKYANITAHAINMIPGLTAVINHSGKFITVKY